MNFTTTRSRSVACLQTLFATLLLLLISLTSLAQTYNTATGTNALKSNTTGTYDTADGYGALFGNLTGGDSTALGALALYSSNTGNGNTALGAQVLYHNTSGSYNTATSLNALVANTTGDYNCAYGVFSLVNNVTGSDNVAVGYEAGLNITGSDNISVGYQAGQNITGSDNITMGNVGAAADNGVIRIGTAGTHTTTYIAGINGVISPKGIAVYIDSQGQLGTFTSSRRYKKDIRDMGDISRKLMALRPVSFRYKQAAEDGTHPLEYGLIAEEVAKVCPELVAYDRTGKPYSVNYHLLTPMLLNEVQKAHRQVAAIQSAHAAQVAALKAMLTKQGQELAALKQEQQQQLVALAKLTASLQDNRTSGTQHQTVFLQH